MTTTDWKKSSAATLDQGEDIEKAFLDQLWADSAQGQPIMKAPFRVGFEIVNKNDTNTRMAGIFIFRINGELLFAPVFFINGNIKGTDLLYRHTPKRFVPLTNDWADYLLGVHSQEEGRGVPRTERSKSRSQLDLRQIVHPPSLFGSQTGSSYGSRKYASFAEQLSPEDRSKWDEFTKNATETRPLAMKSFVTAAGMASIFARLSRVDCFVASKNAALVAPLASIEITAPSIANKRSAPPSVLRQVLVKVMAHEVNQGRLMAAVNKARKCPKTGKIAQFNKRREF